MVDTYHRTMDECVAEFGTYDRSGWCFSAGAFQLDNTVFTFFVIADPYNP